MAIGSSRDLHGGGTIQEERRRTVSQAPHAQLANAEDREGQEERPEGLLPASLSRESIASGLASLPRKATTKLGVRFSVHKLALTANLIAGVGPHSVGDTVTGCPFTSSH